MDMSMKEKHIVKDSLGNILRVFSTYQQAMTYKIAMGRHDWIID